MLIHELLQLSQRAASATWPLFPSFSALSGHEIMRYPSFKLDGSHPSIVFAASSRLHAPSTAARTDELELAYRTACSRWSSHCRRRLRPSCPRSRQPRQRRRLGRRPRRSLLRQGPSLRQKLHVRPKLDVKTRADNVDGVGMRMRVVGVVRQVFKPSRHCGGNLALDPEPPDEPSVGAATVD